MALQYEQATKPSADPEQLNLFITSAGMSLLLHFVSLLLILVISKILAISPPQKKPKEPESYVVHLMEPGPPSKATAPETKKTRKKIKNLEAIPLEKSTVEVKKIEPVTKKTLSETPAADSKKFAPVPVKKEPSKPLTKTVVTQKEVREVEKEDQAVASLIQKKRTGGTIDIRKFPYEWYLRIMESKIYRNWDTLSVNFFTDRTVFVRVYFQVDRGGKVRGLKIEQTSTIEDIDNSAMEAVAKSEPFPPLPPGYKESVLEVHFGFRIEPNNR